MTAKQNLQFLRQYLSEYYLLSGNSGGKFTAHQTLLEDNSDASSFHWGLGPWSDPAVVVLQTLTELGGRAGL